MDKELVIATETDGVQIALLEDKRLVELHKEKDSGFVVGDIYFGKVKKIMQGLNAAFVDVGGDKEGFMHYLDLGPDYNSVDKYMRLAMNGDASVKTLDNFSLCRLPKNLSPPKVPSSRAIFPSLGATLSLPPSQTRSPSRRKSKATRNVIASVASCRVSVPRTSASLSAPSPKDAPSPNSMPTCVISSTAGRR